MEIWYWIVFWTRDTEVSSIWVGVKDMSIDAITQMNWELEQNPGRITLKEVRWKEVPGRKLQKIREVEGKPGRGGPEKAKQKKREWSTEPPYAQNSGNASTEMHSLGFGISSTSINIWRINKWTLKEVIKA